MKQDDTVLQKMPACVSQDYFELQLALCAGEKDLEERRKSCPRSSLQVREGQRSRQQRTYSCRYPSSSSQKFDQSPGRNRCPKRSPVRPRFYTGDGDVVNGDDQAGGGASNSPKSHSAPQSRSSSWKKMRRPRDVRHFREVYGDGEREMTSRNFESLEETIISKLHELKLLQDKDCCVVRSFSTSPKGIINRGDSFKRKTEAIVPVPSCSELTGSPDFTSGDVRLLSMQMSSLAERSRSQSWNTRSSPTEGVAGEDEDVCSIPSYTVLVMGDHGVGKTALLQQFMTSEFMAAIETTFDMECEKTVSVLLDGQETILNFVDLPISVQKECVQYAEIEAYLITYSITERESFDYAVNILQELRRLERLDAAVILVANKNDLVRSRQVTEEEGKSLCELMNCKYIEVSAALNHRVDELLVGLVQQIRLNPRRQNNRSKQTDADGQKDKHSGCLNAALTFIADLIRKRRSTSRSCENLWVL